MDAVARPVGGLSAGGNRLVEHGLERNPQGLGLFGDSSRSRSALIKLGEPTVVDRTAAQNKMIKSVLPTANGIRM